MGRDVKAGATFRYSIIVDSATNFRVWSLTVSGASIAVRVTKLRKNRSRRGRPQPPSRNRGGRAGTVFLFDFACPHIHKESQTYNRSRPLFAASGA